MCALYLAPTVAENCSGAALPQHVQQVSGPKQYIEGEPPFTSAARCYLHGAEQREPLRKAPSKSRPAPSPYRSNPARRAPNILSYVSSRPGLRTVATLVRNASVDRQCTALRSTNHIQGSQVASPRPRCPRHRLPTHTIRVAATADVRTHPLSATSHPPFP